ncbi:GNAT family N-acetyltransferase [Brevibacterium yomogidense]|uniref:GNAT family N-acetyltransferase n=1 Tax=Brevibacterium yomogidense TaxID=946573 RepID=UPI000B35B82C|nr:GNAT family protein [Brevibacterium yomogidense]
MTEAEKSSEQRTNEYGRPVGPTVADWAPVDAPGPVTLEGRYCRLEPLDAGRHADQLFEEYVDTDPADWTYMSVGPFSAREAYREWVESAAASTDPRFYAVVNGVSGGALGTVSLMRQDLANGVIEVGNIMYSKRVQRTPISTEVQYLLMRYVFDELGNRRYEWKCDNLNKPSRRAAARLGFTYEGTFRQAVVYKGRSRDTAWFSMIDNEWLRNRDGFEEWLDPANFDDSGSQRGSLKVG